MLRDAIIIAFATMDEVERKEALQLAAGIVDVTRTQLTKDLDGFLSTVYRMDYEELMEHVQYLYNILISLGLAKDLVSEKIVAENGTDEYILELEIPED